VTGGAGANCITEHGKGALVVHPGKKRVRDIGGEKGKKRQRLVNRCVNRETQQASDHGGDQMERGTGLKQESAQVGMANVGQEERGKARGW